ncbi:MAG: hypothetical protein R2873_20155 [Caldilineaceae bacterium]|nr:hypothetical protein [Caldilineaceae bacterium]
MRRMYTLAVVLLAVIVVVACSNQAADESSTTESTPALIGEGMATVVSELATPMVSLLPTATPFIVPADIRGIEAAPDSAVVMGRLISSITSLPITDTSVRLAEIYYADPEVKDPATGAWAMDNAFSPYALTNDDGLFVFRDVEPKDYVVYVGDMIYRWTVAVNEDGLPRPYYFEPGTVTDLGDIVVDFEP